MPKGKRRTKQDKNGNREERHCIHFTQFKVQSLLDCIKWMLSKRKKILAVLPIFSIYECFHSGSRFERYLILMIEKSAVLGLRSEEKIILSEVFPDKLGQLIYLFINCAKDIYFKDI